ncbi:heme exporter protein CcmD [Sulfitobacter sp. SK012]|uniref:heme exporter protein CcmD n=1 Tax=Sulfitobacter sp. SK012 TaxID=1389005 RepID=UPI000E0A48F5|nr:heme exporter protein CcmD [Sulfitobacter sp. SK012]AXI47249.1 heme exporter protein CcmD [Sulfitobacter sp. SK012]
MPELGKYATEVVSAYAVSLLLLAGFLAITLIRGRRARAALAQIETEAKRHAKA